MASVCQHVNMEAGAVLLSQRQLLQDGFHTVVLEQGMRSQPGCDQRVTLCLAQEIPRSRHLARRFDVILLIHNAVA